MNKLKTRIASIMIAVFAILGFGAMATPASADVVTHCKSPVTTWQSGYWKGKAQYCYVDYNWYQELYSGSRDGYKLMYKWTENTISGAKQNFVSYSYRYGNYIR